MPSTAGDDKKTSTPPVPLELVLVLINSYVDTTARFLNQFVADCDHRLQGITARMDRMEMEVAVLEGKLGIVQGGARQVEEPAPAIAAREHAKVAANNDDDDDNDAIAQRYLGMLKVGVPRQAVLLKMQAGGHYEQYGRIL